MAVWSYSPQQILTQTVATDGRVTFVSPAAGVAGYDATSWALAWDCRYVRVDSITANSMAAMYIAQQGPLLAFDFFNLNDQRTYRVRFDSALTLAHFEPGLFSGGTIRLVHLVGS